MKILLIGATGMIGSRVLNEAAARGHEVIAGARNADAVAKGKGVTAIVVDVADAEQVAGLARGVDVIVSAVSPRSTDDAMTEATGNAAALMQAAKAAGKRLLVVGGAGSLMTPEGASVADHVPDMYKAEAKAMRAVKDLLVGSDVDWTYFAPAGMIEPGARTGKFRLGGTVIVANAAGDSAISAEDYAVALVDELETPANRKAVMTIGY